MSLPVLAFVDLDDTLFQTRAKCPTDGLSDDLQPASTNEAGQPHGFSTGKQRALLEHLLATATVIPTTGRNMAALKRVNLPVGGARILNHGATILDAGGTPDPTWQERTRGIAEAHHDLLRAVRAELAEALHAHSQLRVTLHAEADGIPIYALIKSPRPDRAAMQAAFEAVNALAARHPELHPFAYGRAVTLIPRETSKAAAVRELIRRHGGRAATLSVGVGDALSDSGFMAECDYALTPRASQIMEALLELSHVRH